jgi:hypothetical protein
MIQYKIKLACAVILIISLPACSLFVDSVNSNVPAINVLEEFYFADDTVHVEIINTTDSPIQVQFWALPFYRFISDEWVGEFIGYPGATSGNQISTGPYVWTYIDPGAIINETVSLGLFDCEEGNYRVRLYYRFKNQTELSYVYSNDFQLFIPEDSY